MPIIGILLGGINIAGNSIKIGAKVVKWGFFLQSIIDFTIITFDIFVFVKFINILQRKRDNEPLKLAWKKHFLLKSEIIERKKSKILARQNFT